MKLWKLNTIFPPAASKDANMREGVLPEFENIIGRKG
jgi:hypothetical protein